MRRPLLGVALGAFLWLPAATQAEPTRVRMFGLTATIDIPSSATDGRVAVVSMAVPPSGGPPAHRHSREDEVFAIKAGSYRFLMDGVCIDAGPGAGCSCRAGTSTGSPTPAPRPPSTPSS
jgi:hypothetical protein